MIGDHNAKPNGGRAGNFFWKEFPNSDTQHDFFVSEPFRMGEEKGPEQHAAGGDVLWGGMTTDGKLIGVSNMLYMWNSFPDNQGDAADIVIGALPGQMGYDFGGKQSGDGTGAVVADGRLYISLANGNKIVGFSSLPAGKGQKPDFAIGSPDINTNTLETNYIISNPRPLTDGNSLIVVSDFDGMMHVWKSLPDESGAHPDITYDFRNGTYRPNSETLHEGKLITASADEIHGWSRIPLNGEMPDIHFKKKIGNAELQSVGGIALDSKYFFIGDGKKIYVWEGIPSNDTNPRYTLSSDYIGRLSSDGNYLVTTTVEMPGGAVIIFRLNDMTNTQQIMLTKKFNLPQSAMVWKNRLFVADTGFNRVLIWNNIEDAIKGKDADIIIGAESLTEVNPEIGKNKLFWPGTMSFDGSYLWVGEFKFSERLLRFSVKP
ncbi:hypothetical protein HYU11_02985 [Candidatus Woesearchaeota archaeon]|nr:hypothetical protein [Candidatus Woesearchaeota archaeon]